MLDSTPTQDTEPPVRGTQIDVADTIEEGHGLGHEVVVRRSLRQPGLQQPLRVQLQRVPCSHNDCWNLWKTQPRVQQ